MAIPEKTFKAGPIEAAVWSNEGSNGSFTTVQLSRTYKDKSGAFKRSDTLRTSDIPRATLVLSKAYEYLTMRSREA